MSLSKQCGLVSLLLACGHGTLSRAYDVYNGTVTSYLSLNTSTVTNESYLAPPGDWVSPEYKWLFMFPVPVPSVKQPKL
jgi:bilirubin oxidase